MYETYDIDVPFLFLSYMMTNIMRNNERKLFGSKVVLIATIPPPHVGRGLQAKQIQSIACTFAAFQTKF